MSLDLQDLINNGLLDQLANRFTTWTDCHILLTSIGFPAGAIPNFDHASYPLEFWLKVGQAIDKVLVPTNFEALLAAAAHRLPGNRTFAPFGLVQATEERQPDAYIAAVAQFYDAFLSYSNRDREVVQQIAVGLRKRGVQVWFDQWETPAGQIFADHLNRIIDNVKVTCVICGVGGITPWQSAEVAAALNRAVQKHGRLIPILLPGVTLAALPPLLRIFSTQFATQKDILDPVTLDQLADAIRHGEQPLLGDQREDNE